MGNNLIRKVAKTKDNLKKCLCITCTSYTFTCKIKAMPNNISEMLMLERDISEVEHMEGMFCAFGQSKCITEEKGCMCISCEVHKSNNLDNSYFCTVLDGKLVP